MQFLPISKEDMTVADVNIVKDLLKNGYGKNGYTVIACCEEDSFGNPVYLSEKYYHNSTFRNYNKNHGVFPNIIRSAILSVFLQPK